MSEFEFIRDIKKRLRIYRREVGFGIGDDCALLKIGNNFIVTVDAAVENVHFERGWGYPYLLGRKFVRINVSDIYVKGGEPVAAFLSAGIKMGTKKDKGFVNRYIAGIIDELSYFHIQLAGGNVSAVKNDIFFDMTLIGKIEKSNFKKRDGAIQGDLIAVSGTLGDSMAGLLMLKDKRFKKDSFLIHRFLLPEIKNFSKKGFWRYVTSSIDISDGLYGDLSHILKASRCGAIIFADRIPVSENLRKFCKRYNLDIYRFAIGGGEDYRMLFTLRANTPQHIIKESGLFVIGRIEKGSGLKIVGSNRKYRSFQHF